METAIHIFLLLLAIYILIGMLFAIYFFFKGAFLIDNLITESKWTMRLLLLPGAIGLWPILLLKITNRSRTKI